MENRVLMECGCVSSAEDEKGNMVCPVHYPAKESMTPMRDPVNLDGRVAQCVYCKTEEPSSLELPFFEIASGPKTWTSENVTKVEMAREKLNKYRKEKMPKIGDPEDERIRLEYVEARNIAERDKKIEGVPDRFYCGCRGFD